MLTNLRMFENVDRIWGTDSLEGTQYIFILKMLLAGDMVYMDKYDEIPRSVGVHNNIL